MRTTLLLVCLVFPLSSFAADEPNPYFENAVTNFSTSELEWRIKEAHELIHKLSELGKTRELSEAEQNAKFWAFQASKAFNAILLERKLCASNDSVALRPDDLQLGSAIGPRAANGGH